MPVIQCGASTRDLLHSAMFSVLEQLAIKFFKKQCINNYEVIVN